MASDLLWMESPFCHLQHGGAPTSKGGIPFRSKIVSKVFYANPCGSIGIDRAFVVKMPPHSMTPTTAQRGILLVLLALLATLSAPLRAADMTPAEAQIIAERICSFAHFVEWPAKKFAKADSPIVIGIYGADVLAGLVRETIQDRHIKDHAVVVKQVSALEEMPACHVLFISRTENGQLPRVLGPIRHSGVLSIGESDSFLNRGGVINLIEVGGAVRFQISVDAARRERLNISSKLLQLSLPENGSIVAASESGMSHP